MNRASARSESLTYLLNVLMIGRTRCGKLNFALLRWGSLESHRAPRYVPAAFVLVAPEKRDGLKKEPLSFFTFTEIQYNCTSYVHFCLIVIVSYDAEAYHQVMQETLNSRLIFNSRLHFFANTTHATSRAKCTRGSST